MRKLVQNTVAIKNRNDAKFHYNFHLNWKIHQKNIIVMLIVIASTNMNTLEIIWTSNIVTISLESPKH